VTPSGTRAGRIAAPTEVVRLPDHDAPILMVVVVAEEEFDWSKEFDRSATSVTAIPRLARAQAVFDEFGIVPTYPVDYPVVANDEAAGLLREIADDGRCVLGAHLHPWVTPPFEEEVCVSNSFPGNLDPRLEAEKLDVLLERMEGAFGKRPDVYQAGRYGFGPNTTEILRQRGFVIDLSATPPFDFGEQNGPDFSAVPPDPFWLDRPGGLLEIPMSGAYVGYVRRGSHRLYRTITSPTLRWARLPGILARLRAVERMRLTPEGLSLDDLRRLTRALLDRGTQVLAFSYHAPSLKPGCTPYVRSEAELERFQDCCRRFFEYVLGELGGVTMTPTEFRRRAVG